MLVGSLAGWLRRHHDHGVCYDAVLRTVDVAGVRGFEADLAHPGQQLSGAKDLEDDNALLAHWVAVELRRPKLCIRKP